MIKTIHYAFILLLGFCSAAFAQQSEEFHLLYVQDMEGVYFQNWSAVKIGSRGGGVVDVYVVGDGKMGDFFGVLAVNCRQPESSDWIAHGGYVTVDRVPAEAISGVRNLACD